MKSVRLVCYVFAALTLFSIRVRSYTYTQIEGGQVLKNRISPSIQPRMTVAPNVRAADVNFQVTPDPFHPEADPRVEKFRHVDSDVFRVCPITDRKPCGITGRSDCARWGCCWDSSADVQCAEAKYMIVETYVCGSSRTYNARPRPIQDLKNNFWMLMLSKMMRSADVSGRITYGNEARPNSLPWTARIYDGNDETKTSCAGALISHQWVLTAAHCMRTNDPTQYTVVLGDHDVTTRDGKEQFIKVVQLIYGDYNTATQNNDIALVKLASPAVYNDYVSSVCVPPQDFPVDTGGTLIGNFYSKVVGWGFTETGSTSPVLKEIDIAIVPDTQCQTYHNTVLPGHGKFCAGAGNTDGKDSCRGDSGGPLVNQGPDGKIYVYGLVSYGETCGKLPGIYTKVPMYSNWIFSHISK